jgi:O-antigen ligase
MTLGRAKEYPTKRTRKEQLGITAEPAGSPKAASATPAGPGGGAEILHRTVLVLVTALIVARPLILGEDPGMLSDLTDSSNMIMTLLWLVAAALWGAYRLAVGKVDTPPRGWSVGAVVEIGLLATVVIVILSALVDFPSRQVYRQPARLIAWEWVGLFAAFFVVRRLSARAAECHGLYTALLASAASIAAYTVWQTAVEMPRLKKQVFADRTALQQALAREGGFQEANEAFEEAMRRRAAEGHAFGTFAHPNSLAGYLILLLPGLVGAALLLMVSRGPRWQTGLAWGAALLGAAGLWLTHSRGALLGGVLVGLAIGGHGIRGILLKHKVLFLATVVALAAIAYGAFAMRIGERALGKGTGTMAQRIYYWTATASIIRGHAWFGVGPGNFATAYTQVMDPQAGETIKDPHNFILETWATSGLFALLALLATLALFLVPAVRALLRPWATPTELRPAPAAPAPSLRWEYYVGGMIGILLGFVLRAGDQPSTELVWEAVAAGIRAVVWFGAFGLLELVPWTAWNRLLALSAGVAALLLNLCVSGGIGVPSVANPFWVAVALGCGLLPIVTPTPAAQTAWVGRPVSRVLEVVPLPVFLALALAYFTYILEPVTSAMARVRDAMDNGKDLLVQLKEKKGRATRDPIGALRKQVIRPLEEAARLDRENARIRALLAGWYGRLWGLEQMSGRAETPQTVDVMKEAIRQARRAQELDPHGREGYLAEYQVSDLHFGSVLEARAKDLSERATKEADKGNAENYRNRAENFRRGAKVQYRNAAKALLDYEPNDPTDPVLHYLIAVALAKAGEAEPAQQQARTALDFDSLQGIHSTRRLTDRQREELEDLLRKALAG